MLIPVSLPALAAEINVEHAQRHAGQVSTTACMNRDAKKDSAHIESYAPNAEAAARKSGKEPVFKEYMHCCRDKELSSELDSIFGPPQIRA